MEMLLKTLNNIKCIDRFKIHVCFTINYSQIYLKLYTKLWQIKILTINHFSTYYQKVYLCSAYNNH